MGKMKNYLGFTPAKKHVEKIEYIGAKVVPGAVIFRAVAKEGHTFNANGQQEVTATTQGGLHQEIRKGLE
jgi:hypothetical protein